MAVTTSVQMLSSRRIPIILEPPAVPSLSCHGAQNDLKPQGMPASRYQVIDRAQAGHQNHCRKCTANVADGSFSSDQAAPDALGMSASLPSRPNLRTAAIRRCGRVEDGRG